MVRKAKIFTKMVAVVALLQFGSARADVMDTQELLKGKPIVATEDQGPDGKHFVKAKILINASPELVWQSVHNERKSDPDIAYSKILEQDNNKCQLEQKFVLIPIIGAAVCVMNDTEIPYQRIDYKLVKSDRFKSMEGSWVLTPYDNGHATILELSSHLDLGLPIPRAMMDGVASKKLERRLQHVKEMSETDGSIAHLRHPAS